MGINIGKDGRITPYGQYSASVTIYSKEQLEAMKKVETAKMDTEAAKKNRYEIEMERQAKVRNQHDIETMYGRAMEEQQRQYDAQIQQDYAKRMRNEGQNIVTYTVDLNTRKVYNSEGELSEDGTNQLHHYEYVVGKYGDRLADVLKNSGDYIVIGEEGLGSNFTRGGNETTPGNMNKDPMNDRITILMREGDRIIIKEVDISSVDSTNYIVRKVDGKYYVVGYDGRKHYATLAPGKYRIETFIRLKDGQEKVLNVNGVIYKYLAFRTTDQTPTVGMNPAYPDRGDPGYAEGILYHANNTKDWNTSEGCQVSRDIEYVEVIKMFGTYNSVTKQWEFNSGVGRKGYYYLINQ